MRKFFTLGFWDYALERALKTAIQVLISGGLLGQELFAWDWAEIASLAGAAALTSIAMSFLAFKGDGTDNANTNTN